MSSPSKFCSIEDQESIRVTGRHIQHQEPYQANLRLQHSFGAQAAETGRNTTCLYDLEVETQADAENKEVATQRKDEAAQLMGVSDNARNGKRWRKTSAERPDGQRCQHGCKRGKDEVRSDARSTSLEQ